MRNEISQQLMFLTGLLRLLVTILISAAQRELQEPSSVYYLQKVTYRVN